MKIRNSGGESLVKYERQNPFSIIALPRNALNVSLSLSRFRFFPSWHNPLSRYRRRFFPPLSAVASHRIGRSDNGGISFWRGRDASHPPPLSVVRSRVSVKVEYREHGEKLLKLTPPPKKLFFRTFRYFETGPPTGDFPLPMFTWWTRFSRYQSYECVSFSISRNRSEEKSSSSYERIHLNSEFFLVESLSCTRGNCSELYITRNVNRDDFYTLTFAYLAQQCLLIFVEILLLEMVIEERDYFLSLFFIYRSRLFLFHSSDVSRLYSLRRINEFSHELSLAPLRQLCSTRNKRERDKKKLRKKRRISLQISRIYFPPKPITRI